VRAFKIKKTTPRELSRRIRDAFRLEPLEARVLLSADPVLGPAQIVLMPPADHDQALAGAYDFAGADPMPAPAPATVEPIVVQGTEAAGSDGKVVIGADGASTPIVLSTTEAGGLHFQDGLVLYSNGVGGEVFVYSDVTAADITINGSGHTTTIVADLTATVGDYTLNDSARVRGAHSITAAGNIVMGLPTASLPAGEKNFVGGDPSTASGDVLTLHAGGNVTFNGVVAAGEKESADSGSTDLLNGITVAQAMDVVFEKRVSMAGDLRINATGNVTFKGAITLSGGGADLVIGAESAGTPATAHDVVFEEAVTIDGNLIINATGNVIFKKGVTITHGGDLIVRGASQLFFVAGSSVTLSGTAGDGTSGDVWLQADEIDLSMSESTFRGQGLVTLLPTTVSLQMALGSPQQADTENVLNLETQELRSFADGFSGFVIGHGGNGVAAADAGTVLIGANATGALWRDDVTVYGGSITVADFDNASTVLRLSAGETLTLVAQHNIQIYNEIEAAAITLVSEHGKVSQVDAEFDPDGRSGEALRTLALTVRAGNGVALGSVETATLDVGNSGDGDIAVVLNAARSTSMFTSGQITGDVSVLRLEQGSAQDSGGISLLAKGGSITVAAGGQGVFTRGTGAIALQAQGSGEDIVLQQSVTATSGGITLTAADEIAMASSGVSVSATAAGGHATLTAQGNVTLGLVEVHGALAITSTGGAIVDGLQGHGINLRAASATLKAATGIGAAEPASGSTGGSLRTELGSLAADNSGNGGLFVIEKDGLTLNATTLAGVGVGAGALSLTLLTGDLQVAGAVKSTATGTDSGHILLSAQQGSVTLAANLVSGSGSISVLAQDALRIGVASSARVQTQAAGQTVELQAGGALTMGANGSVFTNNGAQRLAAGTDVVLGSLDAGASPLGGTVSVTAGGSISDGNDGASALVNVKASNLRLQAGGNVGSALNAIETSIGKLSAAVGGSLFVSEANGLEIAGVQSSVNRIGTSGRIAGSTADTALLGLSAGGDIVITNGTTHDGALVVSEAVTVAGSGNVRLEAGRVSATAPGSLALNAAIGVAAGSVTLLAQGAITQSAAGDITTGGAGTVDVQSFTGATRHGRRRAGADGRRQRALRGGHDADAGRHRRRHRQREPGGGRGDPGQRHGSRGGHGGRARGRTAPERGRRHRRRRQRHRNRGGHAQRGGRGRRVPERARRPADWQHGGHRGESRGRQRRGRAAGRGHGAVRHRHHGRRRRGGGAGRRRADGGAGRCRRTAAATCCCRRRAACWRWRRRSPAAQAM
jgi:hypothetical protein